MFRPQEISATDARKYFSQIINKVQFSSKSFVVKSYRRPVVRIVREEYIAALEQVIGKKTVNQVLELSGNENIPGFVKVEEIKKIFQRRLSGTPRPESRPERTRVGEANREGVEGRLPQQPQQLRPQRPQKKQGVAAGPRPAPKLPTQNQKPQPPPKPKNPNPRTSNPHPPVPNPTSKNRGVLLLSNGKNYQ